MEKPPLETSNSPSAAQRMVWKRAEWLYLAALLAVTFLCYLPALGYAFVYDDRTLLLNNAAILSWRSIPDFFLRDFTSVAIPIAPAVYYRPLLLVWMTVNAKIWGMHPAPWHFTAIALHLVVIVEVYALARRLLSSRFDAGVAAGVFALHPLHVECVAWIMAEAEQLSAVLLLASLLSYFRTHENSRRQNAWRALSLGLFAAGLLIKEAVIMLPALIVAYEWFYKRPSGAGSALARPARIFIWKRRAVESLHMAAPYFVIVALYLVVRVSVLKGLGHINTPLSFSTFLSTLPVVLFRYTRMLLWPVGLSVCYDVPYVHHLDFRHFVLPLAVVLLFSGLIIALAFEKRQAAFAAVWLLLPLLPALDLPVFFRSEIVHDRYLYLPSIGFALLVGTVFGWPGRRLARQGRQSGWPIAAAVLLLGLLGAGTCYARRFWKDDWTLFHRAVEIAPHNVIALHDLADEYADRGRYEDAIRLYQRVLVEYPGYWESAYNAGYCLYKLGRLNEASVYFQRAFESDSMDPEVCIYYGMTSFRLGRLEQAQALVRRAIALRPGGRGYHLALGTVLRDQGDLSGARREYRAELANFPDEAAAAELLRELESPAQVQPQKK